MRLSRTSFEKPSSPNCNRQCTFSRREAVEQQKDIIMHIWVRAASSRKIGDSSMPEEIRMKIGRASYIQRIGEKDYLKTRSRIESVPMRQLAKLARMTGRTWRLHQEGNDIFLILEATPWEEEERMAKKGRNR